MYRWVIALSGLVTCTGAALAGPGDLFTEKTMDFGVTPRGTVLVHYFRFTNTTNQTLSVGNPRVSCGCVSAAMSSYQIAPGESAAVVAYMDTRRIPQPNVVKSVTIYVPFISPQVEEVALRVQTVARDDLLMNPDVLAFGTVSKGQGGKATTKVTFLSDPNWKVTEATSTGAYVSVEFQEESRNGSTVTYSVTATLDKKCPAGNWTSDIYLKTTNTAVAKLRIPVTVNVVAAVAASPDSVAFGSLAVGTTREQKVTIQSGTNTPFKILEVKGVDEQLKAVIEKADASTKHTIILAAHPATPGGFNRTVEIVTDSKDQPRIILAVTAQVVAK